MTSNQDDAVRAGPETEPAAGGTTYTAQIALTDAPAPPANKGTPASSSMRHVLGGSRALSVSNSPSTANSPQSSRDNSPARPPQRQQGAAGPSTSRSVPRSRKASTEASPSRGASVANPNPSAPTAAAIQRALSTTSLPQLPPATTSTPQEPSRVPRPVKSPSPSNPGDNTPHWPISPRLKSPPPVSDTRSRSRRNSLRSQARKAEPATTPSIFVQSSSPAPLSRLAVKDDAASSDPEEQPLSMKASSRGASGAAPKLETVQEGSLPTTPGFDNADVQSISSITSGNRTDDDERNDVTSSKVTEDLSARAPAHTESGSDTGTIKNDSKAKMQDQRASSSSQWPPAMSSKASFSSLSTTKSRTEGPSRNMTVETETVPSIAQATIGNQDRSASGRVDGSLRLKPSNETIRPRREKQKIRRKAPSINGTGRSPHAHISYHHHRLGRPGNGPRSTTTSPLGSPVSYHSYDDRRSMFNMSPSSPEIRRPPFPSISLMYSYSITDSNARKASSKADVFEQKVASAVDEANSSDSDATFIYESNPPEHQPHRSRHHHSRTPSMTSIASLADPRLAVRDAHKNPGKKTSMKFVNPYNNPNCDDTLDRSDGTVRVGSGRISGGSHHHHHIGRHGQGRGALSHVLVQDSDTSIAQSSRSRAPSTKHTSQPNSPRFHNFNIANGTNNNNGSGNKKQEAYIAYDVDAENVADDEQMPLLSNVRSPRVRTPRTRNSISSRHTDRHSRRNGGWCRRFAGCLVLSILVLVLVFSAVGLVFATTKPLSNLHVREVQNVIASQEELMLDLMVEAVNPNIIGVTVADMDVNIFAKSKHVGSDRWWREHEGHHQNKEDWPPISDAEAVHALGGIDEGTDPIKEPEKGEPRTMLLGRIFHFDSPLNFEGSFFKRRIVDSLGEVRLSHPGNKTEAGGTERWEEVLQYPFELIVRGVLKYELPLSTREHIVTINGSYYYDPDAEKKKLKASEESSPIKRYLLGSKSVTILPKPLGRYARAIAPFTQ